MSLRSSVWVRRADRWQIIFHQGSAVSGKEPLDLDPDDILSYAPEVDSVTGQSTGGMSVLLKDGTERRYRQEELEKIRGRAAVT